MDEQDIAFRFAVRVSEAYVHHLIALHRRPVYRHQAGDFMVSTNPLAVELEGYLSGKDMAADARVRFYDRLLADSRSPDSRVVFVMGRPPAELSKRGVRYMNTWMHTYADLLTMHDKRDERGLLVVPGSYGESYDM